MSKTTNYQLTLWDYADEDFSPGRARGDLAANFTKLDTALKAEETARITGLAGALQARARVVVGSYVGTGEELHIELGARPLAVLVEHEYGMRSKDGTYMYGGMAVRDFTSLRGSVTIDNTGFTLAKKTNDFFNNVKGYTCMYLAVLPGN